MAVAAIVAALLAPAASARVNESDAVELGRSADEGTSVVEVVVAGVDELDRLVATGVDLDHHVHRTANGIEVHAVVTPTEAATLKSLGFDVGETVHTEADSEARIAEREATIAAHVAELEAFQHESTNPDVSDVEIIRADYYTSFGQGVLSVEAKWANGQTSSAAVTVQRDSGPGTDLGSGGQQNITRFVDANVNLYHRGAATVATRPDYVRITSPSGDVAVAKVQDWLSTEEPDTFKGAGYLQDFVTSYMTPTELYDRIHQLAADFPDLAEIVELPHKTNGYRRRAQALLDPAGNRVTVDSPSPAAGEYAYAAASYGPAMTAAGLTGPYALADDGSALPNEGCGPFVGFPAGAIALVDRGTCPFVQKTQNAMDAGAIAVVIVNNVAGAPTAPGGTFPGATIPTVMISQADGAQVKAGLPATGGLFAGASVSNAARVGLDSVAWGHDGGNDVTARVVDPGAPSQPLTVTVTGNHVQVSAVTNAAGSRTSTAAQVRNAINAHPEASQLVVAYTYRGNAGVGVVAPTSLVRLSDNLGAPESVSREPHPVYAIKIGKVRDGSKLGVLAYAQEHAREWVPPLVTIETAERLLRNYGHHGPTKQLLNNLEIWIAPSINPDGGHYSFYDFPSQRRTMTRYCSVTGSFDVLARNSWGVDTNRNYDEYSLFTATRARRRAARATRTRARRSCRSRRTKRRLVGAHPNVKFAMNLHSSGNYFMWSPGSYALPGRISAPRPTLEQESFFWGASSQILTSIKRWRGLSVTPARTGPISDVLYSAAGNSGDMLWYKYGIYAWNFEVGTSFQPPWTSPNPNGASAYQETMEYANGLVELMRVAHQFGKDKTRPESHVVLSQSSTAGHVNMRFTTSEPAAVFYTLDGSTPTYASTLYASAGIREGGELLTVPTGTTVHWFSVDSAGNVEKNYRPDGRSRNFNKARAVLGG